MLPPPGGGGLGWGGSPAHQLSSSSFPRSQCIGRPLAGAIGLVAEMLLRAIEDQIEDGPGLRSFRVIDDRRGVNLRSDVGRLKSVGAVIQIRHGDVRPDATAALSLTAHAAGPFRS